MTWRTRVRYSVEVGCACTGHLSANYKMPWDRKRRCGTVYLRGDHVVESWALENEEYAVLLNQRRVPDSENSGVKAKDADCLMDIVLLYRS